MKLSETHAPAGSQVKVLKQQQMVKDLSKQLELKALEVEAERDAKRQERAAMLAEAAAFEAQEAASAAAAQAASQAERADRQMQADD